MTKKVLYLISFLLFALSPATQAKNSCQELFGSSGKRPSFDLAPSPFQARSFLPADYTAEVESRAGAIKFEVLQYDGLKPSEGLMEYVVPIENPKQLKKNRQNFYTVSIQAISANKQFTASFEFVYYKKDPSRVILNNLSISDQTSNAPGQLHQTQSASGASLPVLRASLENIISFLKNRKISTLEIPGTTDYTVSLLYRKFLGFSPKNMQVEENFDVFDQAYRNSKKLPKAIRPKNIDEFSRSLGTFKLKPKDFKRALAQYNRFLNGLPVDSDFQIYRDESGQPISISIIDPTGQIQIFQINPLNELNLLLWQSYYEYGHLFLIRYLD